MTAIITFVLILLANACAYMAGYSKGQLDLAKEIEKALKEKSKELENIIQEEKQENGE